MSGFEFALKSKSLGYAAYLVAMGIICVVPVSASAQTAQDRQHEERDAAQQRQNETYYNHIKPQQDQAAADAASIMARPSNWGPGEVRSPQNHGALAWFEKKPGQYGYIFVKGFITQMSADIQVDMECEKRKLKCEAKKLVSNAWLAVGRYNDRVYFTTATGATRAEAEASVQNQCRRDGTSCTIKDTFEVIPHPRGVNSQKIAVVMRDNQ